MLATLCLVTGIFASGQAEGTSEWLVVPRLSRGQELVYWGTYAEEALGRGAKFARHYQLETRVLVQETHSDGAQVALFTAVKFQGPPPLCISPQSRGEIQRGDNEPRSARLEPARIDLQGRVLAERGGSLAVPLEGPPTLETGVFLEFPNGRVGPEKTWEVMEEGRPPRTWKVVGTEPINGVLCLKLTGIQQSADWDYPRADQTAWRRQDTVWVSPGAGFASRLERVIERREPTRKEPSQRLVINYHLESSLVYPGQLLDMRRQEIVLVENYSQAAESYWHNPGQQSARALDSLLSKISYHCENQPATPYRDALLQLQRRLEAARKGDSLPVRADDNVPGPSAAVGQGAPDFVALDLVSRQTVRLQHLLGRPILLVFYQPNSRNAETILRFAEAVNDSSGNGTRVLGVCMLDDASGALQQRNDLGLSFPVLSGTSLRSLYDVRATPKLVVIDGNGMQRGTFEGWGEETADLVRAELRHWQQKTRN
jgi:peroxiredoxin